MSLERKANRVLDEAKRLAGEVASWADFSAALFDYSTGLVPKTFPDEMERQAFFDSKQYLEINALLTGLMKKFGVVKGSVPQKSGKFLVRVPKTIHQKLENEAKTEGVSLNLLAVTKLSRPLDEAAGMPKADDVIIEAFNSVHEGHSTDWIIVEPYHNRLFIEQCQKANLSLNEYQLNHLLMNVRKNPKNKGKLNPTTRRSGFSDYDDCAFAAEIAIRILQRTRGVTLDRVLCDPALRSHFDEMAMRLAPGQTDLKLRCAALNLRKTHRLQPVDLNSDSYDLVSAGPVKRISLSSIASLPGTYVFYDHTRPIYAGETENLKKRIGMHLEAGLPEWLGAKDDDDFVLKIQNLPSAKRDHRLKWLTAFINRERPVLNYQKIA